jgi:hypothetical protein
VDYSDDSSELESSDSESDSEIDEEELADIIYEATTDDVPII